MLRRPQSGNDFARSPSERWIGVEAAFRNLVEGGGQIRRWFQVVAHECLYSLSQSVYQYESEGLNIRRRITLHNRLAGDFDCVSHRQDVRRLQIAMRHASSMQVVQSAGDLQEHFSTFIRSQRTIA
jgi:hypothetical protein